MPVIYLKAAARKAQVTPGRVRLTRSVADFVSGETTPPAGNTIVIAEDNRGRVDEPIHHKKMVRIILHPTKHRDNIPNSAVEPTTKTFLDVKEGEKMVNGNTTQAKKRIGIILHPTKIRDDAVKSATEPATSEKSVNEDDTKPKKRTRIILHPTKFRDAATELESVGPIRTSIEYDDDDGCEDLMQHKRRKTSVAIKREDADFDWRTDGSYIVCSSLASRWGYS